jgi:hypothetical protein
MDNGQNCETAVLIPWTSPDCKILCSSQLSVRGATNLVYNGYRVLGVLGAEVKNDRAKP